MQDGPTDLGSIANVFLRYSSVEMHWAGHYTTRITRTGAEPKAARNAGYFVRRRAAKRAAMADHDK